MTEMIMVAKLRAGLLSIGLFGLAVAFFCAGARAETVAELSSYRMSDYRAPTPATIDGQKGLTIAEAHALWAKHGAVFIDVLPRVPKPANLAPGTIWRDKPRADIPGSLWLPDTGYGALAPPVEAYFERGLKEATKGRSDQTIVLYCLRQCWMSWNAAKRAKSLGYKNVFWFPDGTNGWEEAAFPLESREPLKRD
jgi:PQQ-dependent catabolism-associated CXXCW motif protein